MASYYGPERDLNQLAATRELPEIRYVSKNRLMEEEVEKRVKDHDKKSKLRTRQIDRKIYLASKVNNFLCLSVLSNAIFVMPFCMLVLFCMYC